MMRLGNRRVCVCGANTAAAGGSATSTVCVCVCVRPCRCVGPVSERAGVSHSSTHLPIHTHSTSSFSPGVSQLPCTYTPPSQTRDLLFISLSLYLSSAGMSHQNDCELCLSLFQLPSPLVHFVCLCRLK